MTNQYKFQYKKITMILLFKLMNKDADFSKIIKEIC